MAPLPDSVSVRVEPDSARVGSGKYLVLHVVLENGGTTDAEITLERMPDVLGEIDWGGPDASSAWGSIGHGPGTGSKKPKGKPAPAPEPPPKEQSTPGFSVDTAYDAKNRSTAFPAKTYGMIGLLGAAPTPEHARVVLPPSTRALATVVWAAKGYDPTKNYVPKHRSNEGFIIPPPEPLKPGKYRLEITTPLVRVGGKDVTVSAAVEVTR